MKDTAPRNRKSTSLSLMPSDRQNLEVLLVEAGQVIGRSVATSPLIRALIEHLGDADDATRHAIYRRAAELEGRAGPRVRQ